MAPWEALVAVSKRTHRRILWMVAPPTVVPPSDAGWAALVEFLRAQVPVSDLLESVQPLIGLLGAVGPSVGDGVGVVTANIEAHPYDLAVLASGVSQVFDVAAGRIWDVERATREHLRPDLLAQFHALSGQPGGADPIVRGATSSRNRGLLREALLAGVAPDKAPLSPALREKVLSVAQAVDDLTARLLGRTPVDPAAQTALGVWLQPRASPVATPLAPCAAWVAAEVVRDGQGELTVPRCRVLFPGAPAQAAAGDAECRALLGRLPAGPGTTVFAPRVLDLLGYLADRDLPLPERARDPGVVAYVLNPDQPVDLSRTCLALAALPTEAQRWVTDFQRDRRSPRDLPAPESLADLAQELEGVVKAAGVAALLDADLDLTLAPLARLERQGGWLDTPTGYSSWDKFGDHLRSELRAAFSVATRVLRTRDLFSATNADLVEWLRDAKVWLPPGHHDRAFRMGPDGYFERYAMHTPEGRALKVARRLGSESGIAYWLKRFSSGMTRLRGVFTPQKTGRWGTSVVPLQSLPKRSPEGRILRSGIKAPPGMILIGADWNAFEARILASLSGDPVLLAAARHPGGDLHQAVALQLFGVGGAADRARAKAALHATIYGQSEEGFVRNCPELTIEDARQLYQKMKSACATAFAYQRSETERIHQTGRVTTRGGWTRSAPDTARSGFNTLVQGLGADLQRHVLRELDAQLPEYESYLVHTAHDEMIVAAPEAKVQDVERLVIRVMEDVGTASGLLPNVPLKVKPPKKGTTWADVA